MSHCLFPGMIEVLKKVIVCASCVQRGLKTTLDSDAAYQLTEEEQMSHLSLKEHYCHFSVLLYVLFFHNDKFCVVVNNTKT